MDWWSLLRWGHEGRASVDRFDGSVRLACQKGAPPTEYPPWMWASTRFYANRIQA